MQAVIALVFLRLVAGAGMFALILLLVFVLVLIALAVPRTQAPRVRSRMETEATMRNRVMRVPSDRTEWTMMLLMLPELPLR